MLHTGGQCAGQVAPAVPDGWGIVAVMQYWDEEEHPGSWEGIVQRISSSEQIAGQVGMSEQSGVRWRQ